MRAGKEFENSSARIISKLNPKSQIIQNVQIKGRLSEVSREVDLQLVDPGSFDLIAFECKDKKRTIDVPVIEAFHTKCLDIGAQRKAIVSNSPYSAGAKTMASKLGIKLLHLVDTNDDAIRSQLKAPAFLADSWCRGFNIGIGTIEQMRMNDPLDPDEVTLIDSQGNQISAYSLFARLWNTNDTGLIQEPGTHKYEVPPEYKRLLDADGKVINLTQLTFSYRVEKLFFQGSLDITETTGLYNVESNSYQTFGFAIEKFAPHLVEKEWDEVDEAIARKNKVLGFEVTSHLPTDPKKPND